jgi:hypothetical protein
VPLRSLPIRSAEPVRHVVGNVIIPPRVAGVRCFFVDHPRSFAGHHESFGGPLLGVWLADRADGRGANIIAIAQHLQTSLTLFRSVRIVSKLAWQVNLHGARMLFRGTDALEVAVVGAGAAGIGAATQLAAARISFTVFEARGRVGGRAYTIADNAPFPLDLGCGWLHSADRNPWTRIAAEAGFTIDKTLPGWGSQSFNLGFSA